MQFSYLQVHCSTICGIIQSIIWQWLKSHRCWDRTSIIDAILLYPKTPVHGKCSDSCWAERQGLVFWNQHLYNPFLHALYLWRTMKWHSKFYISCFLQWNCDTAEHIIAVSLPCLYWHLLSYSLELCKPLSSALASGSPSVELYKPHLITLPYIHYQRIKTSLSQW